MVWAVFRFDREGESTTLIGLATTTKRRDELIEEWINWNIGRPDERADGVELDEKNLIDYKDIQLDKFTKLSIDTAAGELSD